jgi:hypothetical protein
MAFMLQHPQAVEDNGWHGWCIDIRYLVDSWMVTLRAWERLERFMRWEYKKKYGRMPSEEELKRVMSELYASEIMRRGMERAGAAMPEASCRGGEGGWMRNLSGSSGADNKLYYRRRSRLEEG